MSAPSRPALRWHGGADHERLLRFLRGLKGMVVLSGYPASLYDDALTGWGRFETSAHADGARQRIEVVWINPACLAALDQKRAGPLFQARAAE